MATPTSQPLDTTLIKKLSLFQSIEATEYEIYRRLAKMTPNKENRRVLEMIADDEARHAQIWKNYTQKPAQPRWFIVNLYLITARVLGLTFSIKLMEKGEERVQTGYESIINQLPETKKIFEEERQHEQQLITIIHEEKLNYLGSIVLGLNDALVELTGVLVGLSFALQNTKLIAIAGLVTGVAASMSMAASEYLSKKTEKAATPLRAAIYTGVAYIVTVLLLVAPYLVMASYQQALPVSFLIALGIICAFTAYNSIINDLSFRQKFIEMTVISFGVAAISFCFSVGLRIFFNIQT